MIRKGLKNMLLLAMVALAITVTGVEHVWAEDGQVGADQTEVVYVPNDETGIPDTNLYNAILEQIDSDADGKISMAEVEATSRLTLASKEITNIKGIELFTLDDLYLQENRLSDITPLNGMSVRSLNLSDNNISDISPLNGMSFSTLRLKNNNISEIRDVTLTISSALYLSGNKLTTTKGLNIDNNQGFYIIVDLSDNNLKDIDFLEKNLLYSKVVIDNNPLGDEAMKAFDGIEVDTISANNCNLTNLDFLSLGQNKSCTVNFLTTLLVANNKIEDLTTVNYAKYLINLDVRNNKLTSLDSLSDGRFINRIKNEIDTIENSGGYQYNSAIGYCNSKTGVINKKLSFAEGNQITLENAKSILPQELFDFKFYKYSGSLMEVSKEKTDITWGETEPFLTEPYNPIKAFVERMYTVALGRDADETGKENWIYMLTAGTYDGAALAKEFILGAEFEMRGLTNEQYIDVLYETFFNRAADSSGKQIWMTILESGQTREYVLSQFVNLDEFTMLCDSFGIERGVMLDNGNAVNPGIPQFVGRLYEMVLGRNAEAEGLYNNVMALLVKAETAESVAKNFFGSAEYALRNTDDTTYVSDLYNVFMNRTADESGLSFWVDTMAIGMTREEVLSEFAKSQEFKTIATSYGLE